MLDLDAVNANLRNLIRGLLGMPPGSVRPANQNAPTGGMAVPFATVLVSEADTIGVDALSYEDTTDPTSPNLMESSQGMRQLGVSVQFFRDGAVTRAARLGALMYLSDATAALNDLGLGFIRSNKVQSLTALVDTYWEERAQIQLEFYVVSEEQVSVLTYGSFPVTVSTESDTSTEVIVQ